MDVQEMEALALPHKLFAVFTAPDGQLYFRKMWSMRLVGYLSGIDAIKDKGWAEYIRTARIGQVWQVPLESNYSWMVLIRVEETEDKDDTT